MSEKTLSRETIKKLWAVLSFSERKRAMTLLALMLVAMFMETLGISLVLPAFALIAQDDLAVRYPFLEPVMELLGNPGHVQLIIIGMILLVSIYLVKTIFLSFLVWW